MPQDNFSNGAQTTLNGAITNNQATITVNANTGFPTLAQFRIIIDSEIMTVTAGQAGLTWTVTRASEPTAGVQVGATHANGATVTHILTAGGLTNAIASPVAGATWSGTALLTLASVANSYGLTINGPAGAGTSFGQLITAGTNATDYALRVQTQAGVDILRARGDGILLSSVFSPTGKALLGNAVPTSFIGAWSTLGAPTGLTGAVGDFGFDGNGNTWFCTVAGTPGTWKARGTHILAETVLGAPTASFDFQNIPTGYRHLYIKWSAQSSVVATSDNIVIRFNNDSTAVYYYQQLSGTGATAAAAEGLATATPLSAGITGSSAPANRFGTGRFDIFDYAGAQKKTSICTSFDPAGTGSATELVKVNAVVWDNVAVVNRITLVLQTGPNFQTNSIATLYGEGSL